METMVKEKLAGQSGAQQTLVDQQAVQRAVAYALGCCVAKGEILAVAAALHREAARELKTGLVVMATAFHEESASSQVETLETGAVTAHLVMAGVSELVRQATPELWVEIREVLRAPPEVLSEWVRGPAS